MKFNYSQITGRLSAPSPLEIPTKYGKGVDQAHIQYPAGTTFAKIKGGMKKGPHSAVPEAILQKMATFQVANNLPVHIKGGPVDRILMVFTGVVCAVGLIDCARVYYVLSFPQKSE